jgi:hypothetical protein
MGCVKVDGDIAQRSFQNDALKKRKTTKKRKKKKKERKKRKSKRKSLNRGYNQREKGERERTIGKFLLTKVFRVYFKSQKKFEPKMLSIVYNVGKNLSCFAFSISIDAFPSASDAKLSHEIPSISLAAIRQGNSIASASVRFFIWTSPFVFLRYFTYFAG